METNNNEIKKVLTKLEIKQPSVSPSDLRSTSFTEIERKYALSIPTEYKEFLFRYDEVFFDNEIEFKPIESSPLTTNEGKQYFDGFYGLNSLAEQIECYKSRTPNCMIPIGECPGGNLICLGIKEPVYGKIYFWNHENEFGTQLAIRQNKLTEDINLYWDNLHLVADAFIDFLNRLEINQDDFENVDVDLDDVELWLDDDLLDE